MAERNGNDDSSNRGDNPGLGMLENDCGQEVAEGQVTTGGPPGFGIDALLTLHPEERRNVMAAIANSLGGGSLRGDPQTSSLPPHVNTRNVVDAQTMVYPNSTPNNVPQQGVVPSQRQANITHYVSVTDGAHPNQNWGVCQTQAPMGRQVMPNVQGVPNGGQRMLNGKELPPQMTTSGQGVSINHFQSQWSNGRPQPTTSPITNGGLNGADGGNGGNIVGNNTHGYLNGGCNGANINGNLNEGFSYGNDNFNGFNGGNGNFNNGFNGGNLNTPNGVHNNENGAHGFNNAYGDANSGYNARYGMNGGTNGGNGTFNGNGIASPLITNGGMNQNTDFPN